MRTFLQKNGKEFNSLFFQISQYCGKSCRGCYVLGHEQISEHIEAKEWSNLFRNFILNIDDLYTNQITIAVDKLSSDVERRGHMLTAFSEIMNFLKNIGIQKENLPLINLTVNTLNDLEEYAKEGAIVYWSKINCLAISNIIEKDLSKYKDFFYLLKEEYKVELLYNLLAYNKEQVIKNIKEVYDIVDNIHLVMFKNLSHSKESARNTLINYYEIMQEVKKWKLDSKVSFDRCYNASMEKIGCSAGNSLMQIWPDGSISGCPYMKKSETKGGSNYLKILDNLQDRQLTNCESNCIYKEVIINGNT